MKTILIVTGILLLIVIVPLIIAGAIAYKRATKFQEEIDRMIKEYEDA